MGVFFQKEMVSGRLEGRVTLPWFCQGAAHQANRPNHRVRLALWNRVRWTLSHHGRQCFLGIPDSHFLAQCGHIKKRAMQWHFLVLPRHHYIVKIANNLVLGATFENQMFDFGGIDDSIFFSDGEKKSWAMWVKNLSKMDESEVGVNRKYVPYTYKKILTVYQCTPYTIRCKSWGHSWDSKWESPL